MRRLFMLALAAFLPGTASAQFYDLDGTYHCVTAPDAACAAAEAPPPAPPPPPAKDKIATVPTLAEVVERVRKRAPEPQDIRFLQERAETKDPRATEVLAWCNLNGIGMKPDPVAAYLLYRDAAVLGVPNAKKNEEAIYKTRLTSAERQQVLMRQDAH
jgi:TPR repeat protein